MWNGRQEGGEIVQEHDQILGEGVACDLRHEDSRLPVVSVGRRVWVRKRRGRGMLDESSRWRHTKSEHEMGADAKAHKKQGWRFNQAFGDFWIEQTFRRMFPLS